MPVTHEQLQAQGVHFHVEAPSFDAPGTHYLSTCLAQGFRRMGVPVTCNLPHALFSNRDATDDPPAILMFDATTENFGRDLIERVFEAKAPEKFVLCRADNASTIFFTPEVPCLMTHETRFRRMAGSRIPWAFGLSDEILAKTDRPMPFAERRVAVIRNFRPSASQHVRNMLDFTFVPMLEQVIEVDRRHGDDHFDRLRSYMGCLAYGGTWEEDYSSNPYFKGMAAYQEYRSVVSFNEPLAIIRWDSWRWWESLAAGCLTFQLDFEKYGFLLPVMPIPWTHYIPIDLANLAGTLERLMDERPRWAEIAENGRRWAREHYSPDAVAARLADYAAPAIPSASAAAAHSA